MNVLVAGWSRLGEQWKGAVKAFAFMSIFTAGWTLYSFMKRYRQLILDNEKMVALISESRQPSNVVKPPIVNNTGETPTKNTSASVTPQTEVKKTTPTSTPPAKRPNPRPAKVEAPTTQVTPSVTPSESSQSGSTGSQIKFGSQEWRGEDEGSLRKRQKIERQDSAQILYGLDAEIASKSLGKLTTESKKVTAVMQWISLVLAVQKELEFPDDLKSGKVLVQLVNKIFGLKIKYHTVPVPLLERENIQQYLNVCAEGYIGLKNQDLFVVSDLYEEKYLLAVINNLVALADRARSFSKFEGPFLEL